MFPAVKACHRRRCGNYIDGGSKMGDRSNETTAGSGEFGSSLAIIAHLELAVIQSRRKEGTGLTISLFGGCSKRASLRSASLFRIASEASPDGMDYRIVQSPLRTAS